MMPIYPLTSNYIASNCNLLAVVDAEYAKTLQIVLLGVSLGGLLLATFLGAIAWYNSKKPAGLESMDDVPGWVPRIRQPEKKK